LVGDRLNVLRRELIKFYLRYEPKWCPFFTTCRDAEDCPKCIYPYYITCRIYRSRKMIGRV